MKKMFKNLMLVAVAAMAFVACSQEDNDINVLPTQTILEFTANIQDDTRSQFAGEQDGAYLSKWEGNEKAIVVVTDGETTVKGTATIKEDTIENDNATFVATLNGVLPQSGTISVYVGNWFDNGEELNALAPTTQNPSENSVDSSSHILKATTTYEGTVPKDLQMEFKHAIAYGRLTIPFNGDSINSIVVTINGYAYNIKPQYKSFPNPAVIWFACPEMEVETITVDATINSMEYTQTVDMSGKGRKFTVGKVVRFSMNDFEAKQFEADYTATEFVGNGVSTISEGNFFDVKGEDFSFKLHVDTAQSTKTTIADGIYELHGVPMATTGMKVAATDAIFGGESVNLVGGQGSPNGFMTVAFDEITGNYTINMCLVSEDRLFKVAYTGEITEPKLEVVELSTITKGTYNANYGYYQFSLSDGTNDNKLILYIGDNNAQQYSISGGDYTYYSKSYLYAGEYFTADTIYSNGDYLGTASKGTLNVVKDGNNYTMTFDLTATYGVCKFVANVTLVKPEPVQLATPSAKATDITAESITVSWDAVANASGYAVAINGGDAQSVKTLTYTFSGLEAETDYVITVVAKGNSTDYLDSAAATVNAKTSPAAGGGEEDGEEGGGDEGVGQTDPWEFRLTNVAISGGKYNVTLTGTNEDVMIIKGLALGSSVSVSSVTLNNTETPVSGTAAINFGGVFPVVIDITITSSGVKYTGSSINGFSDFM